jgi:pimeloyl-ACP methyl ester carboxylesterase
MDNLRKYGDGPYHIAVVHGGPGAPGEMAPVARELTSIGCVLEPIQTATSLDGQVEELRAVLEDNSDPPITLIGWSWGAWLSFILAAEHPSLVKKLILVSSGPFEEKYAADIMETRLSRLAEEEKKEVLSLFDLLRDKTAGDKGKAMARLGELISRADSFDPMPHDDEVLECQYGRLQDAGNQARELRISGKLLDYGKSIQCPVVAIHGDYDPHPYEGVMKPLSCVLKDVRFVLLEKCGHQPWIESHARDKFFSILAEEI